MSDKLSALTANLVQYHVYRGGDVPPFTGAYDYVLAGDGLYKRARNALMYAVIRVAPATVAGLPPLGQHYRLIDEAWFSVASYLPGELLWHIYRDALALANGSGNLEKMYHLHVEGNRSWASIPEQKMSHSKVTYNAGHDDTVLCDLHSHHNMEAFFSHTDDRDEQGFRFYAVIGTLKESPRLRLRLGIYGDRVEISPRRLFDGLGPFMWQENAFSMEVARV